MSAPAPEPAIAPGEDPRTYARLMAAVYDATMAGQPAPARPRRIIWDSWQRLLTRGLRPDRRTPPVVGPDTVELLRLESGLTPVLDDVMRGLGALVAGGDSMAAIADADCRVLWRTGTPKVLSGADSLGFIEGACWAEKTVGTNAPGLALVSQRTVQTFSAEHYNRNQHPWTCAAAPIRNPRTGRVIGVIDVTGPAATVHPSTVALVDVVARLAEAKLRERHSKALDRLRAIAAPMLAKVGAPALAVDGEGWVAAVESTPVQRRVLLPAGISSGREWIPPLGMCDVEALPGGWLVRLITDDVESASARVTLDLRDGSAPVLEMVGQIGSWRHDISLRHAEILLVLAATASGHSAPELATALYGDPTRVGAVRVEMSRLRKQFAGIVASRPYRFDDPDAVTVRYPKNKADLLPPSTAPAVRLLRQEGGC